MDTPFRPMTIAAVIVLAVVAAACTGTAGTAAPGSPRPLPSGSSAPGSSPSPSLPFVDSPAAAARLVVATAPLFDGIGPKDPNVIGQAAWYEAHPTEAAKPPVGWQITFTVGWGDCPAGCISWHTWTYDIGVDESVTFVSETGLALPPDVIEGLRATSRFAGLGGRVTAGPVCPVVQPGASNCADRPVAGAVLVVAAAGGAEAGRVTSDAGGQFRIPLPPGPYTLTPQPVAGLMGTAAPMPFTVTAGALAYLTVTYDTGIR